MSLLQLLVDMVDDKKGVRGRFAHDSDAVLTAYGVTDPEERNAAKSGRDWELLEVLRKSTGGAVVSTGDKKVIVTFCGVMKGTGGGGGGYPDPNASEALATKRTPRQKSTKKRRKKS